MYKALVVILTIFHFGLSYSQSDISTERNQDGFHEKKNKAHLSFAGPLIIGGVNFERRLNYANGKSFWVHLGLMDYQLFLDNENDLKAVYTLGLKRIKDNPRHNYGLGLGYSLVTSSDPKEKVNNSFYVLFEYNYLFKKKISSLGFNIVGFAFGDGELFEKAIQPWLGIQYGWYF